MKKDDNNELGAFPFLIGWLSLLPLIGVFFGVIAIVLGVISKKSNSSKLIMIGSLGCWVTVASYAGLLYLGFMKPGGFFDQFRSRSAQSNLLELAKEIEFFKAQNGSYPNSLEELAASPSFGGKATMQDPTSINRKSGMKTFYFALTDDKNGYFLFGVGPDNKPFTKDDLLPEIVEKKQVNLGLRFPEQKEEVIRK